MASRHSRGGAETAVYCEEYVVAVKLHSLLCYHCRGAVSGLTQLQLLLCPVYSLSSCESSPDLNRITASVVEDTWFPSVCLCVWHFLTSMLYTETMNKNGMMTKIHTRIRSDPFTACYDLVGKELGRWVC